MKLNPHLSVAFQGDCEEAFKLYARCLEGAITFMLTWGQSPMAADVPAEWGAKIFHATLKIGEALMTGADSPPGQYHRPQGFSIVLQMDDAAAAERVFRTLAENGNIEMPLQETFWASRFAALTDRFGIPWTINCERPADASLT